MGRNNSVRVSVDESQRRSAYWDRVDVILPQFARYNVSNRVRVDWGAVEEANEGAGENGGRRLEEILLWEGESGKR